MTVKIEVIELVGAVTMEVLNAQGKTADCQPKAGSSSSVACDLPMKKGETYDVVIRGTRGSEQRFVIAYYKASNCVPYTLDMPLYK